MLMFNRYNTTYWATDAIQHYILILYKIKLKTLLKIQLPITTDRYYQKDGAPNCSATMITNYLNDNFSNYWIDTNGPIK